MQIYYDRLSAFLKTQTEYKVWSMSGHQRIKIAISQVYDDIYEGKFELLRNGDLHYIKQRRCKRLSEEGIVERRKTGNVFEYWLSDYGKGYCEQCEEQLLALIWL